MRLLLRLCPLLLIAAGIAFTQDTNFTNGPQYLQTNGSSRYARSIATPSMSLALPPLQAGATSATDGLTLGSQDRIIPPTQPDAPPQIDLFPIFYGASWAGEFRISLPLAESPSPLPASIASSAKTEFTTAEALRWRGFGVTIVELAAYEKAHAPHANHVYTNADIEQLHSRD